MYNLRIKGFAGEQDVILYSKPIKSGYKVDEETIKKRCEARQSERDIRERLRSLNSSMRRTKQKVYDYARANTWDWFMTWTFSKERVKSRYDYVELSKRMSQWLKDVRKRRAPDMMYLVVPEYHQDGAIHFHGLMSDIGELSLIDSGVRDGRGRQIYNVEDFGLGFTTATRVTDSLKAANYISKYITAEMLFLTKDRKRYWVSRNLEKPLESKMIVSEGVKQEIIDMYSESAKKTKKIEVETPDFIQKIYYFTIQGECNTWDL